MYKVTTFTGTLRHAGNSPGTDGNVKIIIYGDYGSTLLTKLDTEHNDFEAGA